MPAARVLAPRAHVGEYDAASTRILTLPVVLQRFIGEYDAQWEAFAAGALVVSLPVMALFYMLQKHMVAGLGAGGVKG